MTYIVNIYEQFILHLKKEEKHLNLKSQNLEKHHILPLHDGGLKNGEVVLCTSKNHTLAHYYRFLAYNKLGDKVCFQMRKNSKMSSRQRALLGVEKLKRNKINFFDSNWQSVQGSKKKKVPKTLKQLKACQKIGLNKQKKLLKILLTKKTKWKLSYNSKNKTQVIYKIIQPKQSFQQIIALLKETSYQKNFKENHVFDISCFYKVIKGQRKTAYGWSLDYIYM